MSKFWFSLYYFLKIKRRLSTAFYPQTNGQTKMQNSTMEAYLRVFINSEQNNWVCFLLMAKFAYNNAKNASTGHMPFELNCSYHLRVFFEDDVSFFSRSRFANKLAKELRELIDICWQNLLNTQKLQKKAYDKGIKLWSYVQGEKV